EAPLLRSRLELQVRRITTFELEIRLNRPAKSLSVETRTKLRAEAYSRILRSPTPASPFRRALSESGKRSCTNSTSLGERHRKGASSFGDFAACCQFGGIGIDGQEVLKVPVGDNRARSVAG